MKTVNREIFCILKVPLLDTTISRASDFQLKNELPPEYRESPSFHAKDARSLLSLPLSFPFSPCGKARENDPDAGRFRTGRDPLTMVEWDRDFWNRPLVRSRPLVRRPLFQPRSLICRVIKKKKKEKKEKKERKEREKEREGGEGRRKGRKGRGKEGRKELACHWASLLNWVNEAMDPSREMIGLLSSLFEEVEPLRKIH